jgi:hypothetical protein
LPIFLGEVVVGGLTGHRNKLDAQYSEGTQNWTRHYMTVIPWYQTNVITFQKYSNLQLTSLKQTHQKYACFTNLIPTYFDL